MTKIQELFRESPFEPLRYHMKTVMECVAFVRPMFEAVRDSRFEELQKLANQVFKTEHEADIIKDEIRQTIPKRFFLPVYRGDLLGYLKLQDDMADSIEDIAVLLTIKNLELPKPLVDLTFGYIDQVNVVCRQMREIGDHLPNLVQADMAGAVAENMLTKIAEVDKSEWEADCKQYTLSQKLFTLEDDVRATDIMLWFKIFGELGQLANFAEKTGDRLRRMLAS